MGQRTNRDWVNNKRIVGRGGREGEGSRGGGREKRRRGFSLDAGGVGVAADGGGANKKSHPLQFYFMQQASVFFATPFGPRLLPVARVLRSDANAPGAKRQAMADIPPEPRSPRAPGSYEGQQLYLTQRGAALPDLVQKIARKSPGFSASRTARTQTG